jgi:hypothetical protein
LVRRNKLRTRSKKRQNVLATTTSTNVGWVEHLQTSVQSKNV